MSYKTLSNKFFIRPFSKGFYNSKSYNQEQDYKDYNAGFKPNLPAGPSEAWFLAGGSVLGARLAEAGAHCSLSTSSHFYPKLIWLQTGQKKKELDCPCLWIFPMFISASTIRATSGYFMLCSAFFSSWPLLLLVSRHRLSTKQLYQHCTA